jgi:hypothetical protein
VSYGITIQDRKRSRHAKPQPEWMLRLRVGDSLLSGGGTPRIVRKISRYATGELSCVTFAIRHCSWTTRPYTTVNYNDLLQFGYTPIKAPRYRFKTKMDQKLQKEILSWRTVAKGSKLLAKDRAKGWRNLKLTCCDVHGVA